MSFPSTVLVYEFFAGGGSPGEVPCGLKAEALGMLWALLADFRRWGAVRTVTALDSRFEEIVPGLDRHTLPADEIIHASPGSDHATYLSLLNRCDAALVVAPETGGVLASLTQQAEFAGVPVFGSSSSAVRTAGNKAACHQIFSGTKLPTPRTRTCSFGSASRVAKQLGFPLVIKPVDGVGCEGVCHVEEPSGLEPALAEVRRVTSRDELLLQSVAPGIPVSVSLLVSGERCVPISLNRQLIEAGSQYVYLGSQVPFEHRAMEHCLDLACSAVSLIPGLGGYVGVDLVLADDSAQLIEINPRLTTSYIGIRQVTPVNLCQMISEACINSVLPDRVPLQGQVIIRKDDPRTWGFIQKNAGVQIP